MSDAQIKAHFLFLKYSLNFFNEFNALFQGKGILIHMLWQESNILLKQIGQNFVKAEFLDKIVSSSTYTYVDEYLTSVEKICVGPECEEFLSKNLDTTEIKEVKDNCLKFYKIAFTEMKKRFHLEDPIIKELEFLNPKIALNLIERIFCKNLVYLPKQIKCDTTALAFEWNNLHLRFSNLEKIKLTTLPVDEFWHQMGKLKNFNGELLYPELTKLARYAIALPHSNADAERIFSIVTDIKTKKRNRIGGECLNALCVIRSSFKATNTDCVNFKIENVHLKNFNSNIYAKL